MMYDFEASIAESSNQRYMQALDLLYTIGCEYSMKETHVRQLCDHMGVSFEDLENHNLKGQQCQ